MTDLPALIRSSVPHNSSTSPTRVFSRYPMPLPAPSRSIACSTSMCADSTRMATCGSSPRIVRAASSPSVVWVGGMRMSTIAMSGCSRRTTSIRPSASFD